MKTIKFFVAAAVAAVFAVSCANNAGVQVDAPQPTKADADSVSYLIGVNFGSFIKGNNFAADLSDLNMAQIKKGMEDFIKAEGNPYSPDFGKQFDIDLDQMGRIFDAYLQKKSAYEAAVNQAEGEAFLAKNALKANVDTTASGLQYTIIAEGAEYKVQPQDTVLVNYKGTLIDGTVFDQNDSTEFVANQVIRGWTEGLGLLGEGGKATLYIPAKLGYGTRSTGKIGANSTLIFDVEILKVNKYTPAE
ncbi:MAG: FKBP-type peptidyl-prolyl cis-trans isomerase [Bacteroidales bacterium]|nr:FKBP-type peptidyl-prolyl cis-trans isomerase [Bacteroidales bacterium]